MIQMMGPLPSLYLSTGQLQPRLGSGLPYSIPRGTYRTIDGQWVAVSTSADSVAARVMTLIGLGDDPRVATVDDRMVHRQLVEERMAAWTAERTLVDVLRAFEQADAAAAQVYDMAQLCADPHIQDRGTFARYEGYPMPGVIAGLSATPGEVRHPGRSRGHDNAEILGDLG